MSVRIPRRESVTLWAAIALAIAVMSAESVGADGPRGAEWASKDALIYLEATHPGALLDRVLEPKFQAYLGSIPQYSRFLKSDQFRQAQAGAGFVSNLLDTTWDKGIRNLAAGGIVFVAEAEQGKAPWGFIAITPGDADFLVKAHEKLLGLARNDAAGKGQPDPVKVATHRGIKLYSINHEESHTVVRGTVEITRKEVTHAIVRETLVISQSAEDVKKIIDRSMGTTSDSIVVNPDWKARRARASSDTMAWGLVRLDRLRALDPKKYTVPDMVNPGATFLFGPWIDAVRKAPWMAAEISWSDAHLTAEVGLPTPPDGYSETLKKFLPPKGAGAPAPLKPRGVIASLSLWRDVSSVWEVRNDLFPPEVVQGLAQLDTFAGQYFGGRDFGSGVLGAIGTNWRFVVAEQDFAKVKPVPDLKLPAFALVIDLKPDDDEFAQRLKVAFQSFIGLANLGAAQSKAPPLELGSETIDGVTIATTKFMLPKGSADAKEPVHMRQNFSPSVVQVDNHFILSSSLGLTKDLISAVRVPEKSVASTLLVEADGSALARLVEANRLRLVTQNMLEKGNDKAAATGEIDLLVGLLRYAGLGTLTATDGDKTLDFRLDFALGTK
jgi:hypothetical protein